jgi:ADP-ribose pyrophosphatase
MSEVIHLYVAKGLTKGEMALEDDEQMEPVTIPWETALAWTLDGTIKDAKTITALLLWDHRIRNGIA